MYSSGVLPLASFRQDCIVRYVLLWCLGADSRSSGDQR